MKLVDFKDTVKVEIDRFDKWYRKNHSKMPDRFPLQMGEVEWIEQFLWWLTADDKEKV